MPGSMIHLMLAREVNPQGSDLFYLGNIAPDAVTDFVKKTAEEFMRWRSNQ